MGSEVAVRPNPSDELIQHAQWARAVAGAGIVPAAYANKPGNLIVAAQLGSALGIHPIVAVNQIYIVDGKPSTSGLLIAALIRRDGHKIRYQGNTKYATVTIIRKDDPEFEFTVTWELKKNANGNPSGEEAGLLQKDNWKKYPAGMLFSRALTQVGRIACPESLLGVSYTTEELNPDLATDQHGGMVKTERISFEDLYAGQIQEATTEDELKRLHLEAKAVNVLKVVPTGETRTVLKILNDRMREIKAMFQDDDEGGDNDESDEGRGRPEGESGSGVPEAVPAETAERSGQDGLNPPSADRDDPAYEGIHDAEIVEEKD